MWMLTGLEGSSHVILLSAAVKFIHIIVVLKAYAVCSYRCQGGSVLSGRAFVCLFVSNFT